DVDEVVTAVSPFDLVFHAAGPFTITSDPMLQACLRGGAHYADITGEIAVFENTFRYDAKARDAGLTFISGVGFDVVPSDCLARYVADQVADANELEISIAALGSASAGTTNTMLESLAALKKGSIVRRDGRYRHIPLNATRKKVPFSDGRARTLTPMPWGDLATAYRTTGIPNITVNMRLPIPPGMIRFFSLNRALMSITPIRKLAQAVVSRQVAGPDEQTRQTSRSTLYARAANEAGDFAEAWLETIEGYWLTAVAGVRIAEKIMAGEAPVGTPTPALAFGADFILEIEGTKRFDALPDDRVTR
ncbi:MAG: saccharopine dehydrogenase family protein, partial [Anaerolineae bacterium]